MSIKNWKEYLKSNHIKDMYRLSMNRNITLDDVISNPELPWNYGILTSNENIPMDYILATVDQYPWDTSGFFQRVQFSDKLIKMDGIYYALSRNRNIPFSYVLKYRNKNWDWKSVIE